MADDIRHQINLAPTDAERDVFLEYAKLTGGPGADPEVFVRLVINGEECIRFKQAPVKEIEVSGVLVGPQSEVATTDNTVTTITTIPIPDDTVVAFKASGLGVRTDGIDQAVYIRRALISRRGGGPAVLHGSVQNVWSNESDPSWEFTVVVSGNDALVQVKGAIGKDIDWIASILKTENPI